MSNDTFADRVAELERVTHTNLPTINNAIIADLLTCIREQRAALMAVESCLSAACANANVLAYHDHWNPICAEARAILTKWSLR